MDKQILKDYIDACHLIRETKDDIRKLKKRKGVVQDSVKGSMHEYPYVEQRFHLEGTTEHPGDSALLKAEMEILQERKENAERIKKEAEAFINTAPVRMQRIIRLRVFLNLSWDEVAAKLGRGCTGEQIRKEFERFLEKS